MDEKSAQRNSSTREKVIESRLSAGEAVYPYGFKETHRIEDILRIVEKEGITKDNYGSSSMKDVKVSVGGRVVVVRELGKKSRFIRIVSNGSSIQVMYFKEFEGDLYRGDIIGAVGVVGYSKTGELSIVGESIRVLAPCVHMYPTEHYGLKDPETIYRQRYLDLILNRSSLERFMVRSRVVEYIRTFLNRKGFLEVETPMMQVTPGGAAAKPFKTVLNEMQMELCMRISPELYLKTLLVGGIPRVFELGRQFRNEGIDATHNPEFTSCELYMAYADYWDMLALTEELISSMVQDIFGGKIVEYETEDRETKEVKKIRLDFNTPFKRLDIIKDLSAAIGEEVPEDKINTEEGRETLDRMCRERGVECRAPRTAARLLDKLVGKYLESQCHNPTFIMNHPMIMSPLAKEHRERKGLTERFELFFLEREVCNAYTELNDPFEQRRRFEQQSRDKSAGDEEAQGIDEGFCTALEYGMPPAGGWGIGIDRLVMMLTGAQNIRDVLFFPTMKPKGQDAV